VFDIFFGKAMLQNVFGVPAFLIVPEHVQIVASSWQTDYSSRSVATPGLKESPAASVSAGSESIVQRDDGTTSISRSSRSKPGR
jgi:hypothetical protein